MKIKLQFDWDYFINKNAIRKSHFLSRPRWVISKPFGPGTCKYSRIIKIAWMLMSWILASSAAMILTIVIFFSCRVNHKNSWHLSVEEEYQVHIDNYFHIEKKKKEKKMSPERVGVTFCSFHRQMVWVEMCPLIYQGPLPHCCSDCFPVQKHQGPFQYKDAILVWDFPL